MSVDQIFSLLEVVLLSLTVGLSFLATRSAMKAAESADKTYSHMRGVSKIELSPYLVFQEFVEIYDKVYSIQLDVVIINSGKTPALNVFSHFKFFLIDYDGNIKYLSGTSIEGIFRGNIGPNKTVTLPISFEGKDDIDLIKRDGQQLIVSVCSTYEAYFGQDSTALGSYFINHWALDRTKSPIYFDNKNSKIIDQHFQGIMRR